MQSTFRIERYKKSIKGWLLVFMIMLAVSGITAIPIERELSIATKFLSDESFIGNWLNQILFAVKATNQQFPFLFYGYDWLAFSHVVIAIAFIGPYRDPVRNKWVIEFGAIACFLVVPFALIAGYLRDIPFLWRLVDCSFGIVGLIPLGICYNKITGIENLSRQNAVYEN